MKLQYFHINFISFSSFDMGGQKFNVLLLRYVWRKKQQGGKEIGL